MESDSKPSSADAPNRRSMLAAFNPAGASRQLWRMFSSREKVIEQIKTLLWVIPITLVIWVYAEREQVVVPSAPNVTGVPVTLHIADNLTFEPLGIGDNGLIVSLQLTGPQQALERVRELLTTHIPHSLTIDLGNLPVNNSESVNLLDHISIHDQEMFRSNGVTVLKVTPESINVRVEEKQRKELPVLIPPELDTLTSDTHFSPATVWVSGPKSLLVDCKVYANLTKSQVPVKPGTYPLSSIPLKLPDNRLQTDPPLVQAVLVVRNADVPFKIEGMYIYVQAPTSILSNYDITLPSETIEEVHVVGPADKIKLLTDGTVRPYAVMTITPEDTIHDQIRKPLSYFLLPDGVTVVPADLQRAFDCTLSKKLK